MTEITEVRIYPMDNSGNLKAYATVTLDTASKSWRVRRACG
jgi:DNA-binding cell septation regulator SpoVG